MPLQTLKEKLTQLEKEFNQTKQTVEQMMSVKANQSDNHSIYCYFTFSMILNYNSTNHLIMGNFYIQNISNKILHSPIILLKINTKTEFNFTGKYKSSNQDSKTYNFLWERLAVEDLDPTTHYCFKPTKTDQIAPNEQLGFQSFQIVIPKDAQISVEGFTYFNESNDGIPAINSIHISI